MNVTHLVWKKNLVACAKQINKTIYEKETCKKYHLLLLRAVNIECINVNIEKSALLDVYVLHIRTIIGVFDHYRKFLPFLLTHASQ